VKFFLALNDWRQRAESGKWKMNFGRKKIGTLLQPFGADLAISYKLTNFLHSVTNKQTDK
jgi:hypothetical protein